MYNHESFLLFSVGLSPGFVHRVSNVCLLTDDSSWIFWCMPFHSNVILKMWARAQPIVAVCFTNSKKNKPKKKPNPKKPPKPQSLQHFHDRNEWLSPNIEGELQHRERSSVLFDAQFESCGDWYVNNWDDVVCIHSRASVALNCSMSIHHFYKLELRGIKLGSQKRCVQLVIVEGLI